MSASTPPTEYSARYWLIPYTIGLGMSSLTLRNRVCDAVRARIVSGAIPPGGPLGEERLAAELAVSRTPLREAIRQLVEEGFIEQQPRRSARVVSLTPSLVREVYEVREALEGMAARLAATRMPDAEVKRLRLELDALRPAVERGDCADTGDRIHEAIFAAAGNSELQRLMAVYRARVMWIQQVSFRVSGRLASAYREHESIARALECRDAEWAEAAARAHIRNTLEELIELLAEPAEGREVA